MMIAWRTPREVREDEQCDIFTAKRISKLEELQYRCRTAESFEDLKEVLNNVIENINIK